MDGVIDIVKAMDHRAAAAWAAGTAFEVLHLFESEHPDDMRPRAAIEAARLWSEGSMGVADARRFAFSAHAAARSCSSKASEFAARAAGHAASVPHVKDHAVHVATYARKALDDSLR